MYLRIVFACLLLLAFTASAQETSDSQGKPLNRQVETALNGGSGLIYLQTVPTNPSGTLGLSLHGLYLQHDNNNLGWETITTGLLALTYSVSRNLETYFCASYVGGMRSSTPTGTFTHTHQGIGSQELGLKMRLPLRRYGLFEAGALAGVVLGTAENKIAGFNFQNTRRETDVKLRLVQSLRFQDFWGIPNLHFNEGYLTEHGPAPDLFMIGVGMDYLLHRRWQVMAEFNGFIEQRTPVYLNENYMALTTALRYFAPSAISIDLGVNLGLSKDRLTDDSWRRSDPWQVFAGLTFTPKINTDDRDYDGIPDWLDAELNYTGDTFANVLDTDGDGVPDPQDKQPTSIRGSVVDQDGVALDEDADGVPDGLDRESRTPKEAWVDVNGVAYDTDRDGVPDGLDQEPNTVFGALVDNAGVARDSDNDGVPDGIDQESNTPEGALVDAWGRSAPAPNNTSGTHLASSQIIEKLEASLLNLPNVHFDIGKSEVKPETYSTLDVVGDIMSEYPMFVVLIEGHADATGTPQRNMELSLARARAVRDYLINKYPKLSRSNFTVSGLGKNDPLADDAQQEGRTQNRRVEFKILNREQLQEMITTWE
jgi:outer membrane protein OmpA-like peptidoglycan-associated protein